MVEDDDEDFLGEASLPGSRPSSKKTKANRNSNYLQNKALALLTRLVTFGARWCSKVQTYRVV